MEADSSIAEPDPRVLLANERTLLAWTRTALAFAVGGLGVVQFLAPEASGGLRVPLGVGLIASGATLAIASHVTWRRRDRALRSGQPIAPSRLPTLVLGLFLFAAMTAVIVSVRLA